VNAMMVQINLSALGNPLLAKMNPERANGKAKTVCSTFINSAQLDICLFICFIESIRAAK